MPCCKSLACMGIDGLIVMWDKGTNWNKEVNLQNNKNTVWMCEHNLCGSDRVNHNIIAKVAKQLLAHTYFE